MPFIKKPPRGVRLRTDHHWSRKGLVGCWVMNERGGNTVFDLSGNSNNGTITGAIPPDIPTWTNGGLYSDGADADDHEVSFGNVVNPTTAITLIAGINPAQTQNVSGGRIISKTNGTTGDHWCLALAHERRIDFRINNSYNLTAAEIYPYDQDIVLAGVYDGATRKYFVDGINRRTLASVLGSISSGTNLSLFRNPGTIDRRQYIGAIYFIYVYDRALTSNEILFLSKNPYAIFSQPSRTTLFGIASAVTPESINVSDGFNITQTLD